MIGNLHLLRSDSIITTFMLSWHMMWLWTNESTFCPKKSRDYFWVSPPPWIALARLEFIISHLKPQFCLNKTNFLPLLRKPPLNLDQNHLNLCVLVAKPPQFFALCAIKSSNSNEMSILSSLIWKPQIFSRFAQFYNQNYHIFIGIGGKLVLWVHKLVSRRN